MGLIINNMFNFPLLTKKQAKISPHVIVVLDGFGIAPPSQGNAIALAKTPNINWMKSTFPNTELIASGESVGLPANEVGNTEVGHLTIGAGRVIYQDLKRISMAIEDGSFFDNKAFLSAAAHVKRNNSKLHILGLVGSGNVHSSYEHLLALLQFCKKEGVEKVFLHIFTDGRDSPPKEGKEIIEKLETYLNTIKLGKIASISGRYYAMDRDRRWERTEKAYRAIVQGLAIQTMSAMDAINSAYVRGQTDEFVEPTIIADVNGPLATVGDNDAVIFFNFRIDRPKQLSMALVMKDFENLKSYDFGYNPETSKEEGEVSFSATFQRQKIANNLCFVTMTEYQEDLPVSGIAYGPEVIANTLGETLSASGLKQMHMSESEKERFVTYYFNGLREQPYTNEERQIVPSPKVATYDKQPEMSLPRLVGEFKKQLLKDKYHFFIINFANADMVGHSGNLQAAIVAIEAIDKYLKELVDCVLKVNGSVYITADHGNAEEMMNFPSSGFFFTTSEGSVNTDHSNNPVPLIIINKTLAGGPDIVPKGALSDIAPTVLTLMGITPPKDMTGRILLNPK
jgi:2,3-bisphosphoglycerate-independent phosphoglycerate mutase